MHCKVCEYQLWNLIERRCPECGSPFTPSEYDFVTNGVQFCCPHCDQVYYGTGERGHLVPPEFTCVSCNQSIRMDDMVLRPAPGFEDKDTKADAVPWLERAERGRFKAWLSTIGMALISQTRLMRAHRHVVANGQAWWFAGITNLPVIVLGISPLLAFPATIFIGAMRGLVGGGSWAEILIYLVIGIVLAVLALFAWIGLWGLVTQGILRLADKPAGTIGRTYEALCYSSGANIFSAVPCIAVYIWPIGAIWWVVSAVLMVKERQQVRSGSAALAVLTLPCVSVLGCVIGGMALFSYGMTQMNAAMAVAAVVSETQEVVSEPQEVVDGVLAHAAEHEGSGPEHAIQLVVGDQIDSSDLVARGSFTNELDVPVAETTLAQFVQLSRNRQQPLIQTAVKSLPAGTVAHRLGDFVFTYHGIDLNNPDAGLWIVIESWDPDAQARMAAAQASIAVGFADGTVNEFSLDQLDTQLTTQNALRNTLGLPPLPQPRTVRHGKPAVGAPTTRP